MLGYEKFGSGPRSVVVLNDWLCDTSTWEPARAYLDRSKLTWLFADVRGYGRSRGQTGAFDLEEIASDVLELADALDLRSFAVVGHSMSAYAAFHLAQHAPDRIERLVMVGPPPPAGFGGDDAVVASLQTLARSDDEARAAGLRPMYGERLVEGWLRFKVERWRAASDPEASAAYAPMFARRGLPDRSTRVRCPVLAVTGEQDMEFMRQAAVTTSFSPLCDRLTVAPLVDCGHYPMQEAPPLFATLVERFLG